MEERVTGFARRLRLALVARGISPKELAAMVNVSPRTVYHWVNGSSEPSIEMLTKIAKILKISVDFLLGLKKDLNQLGEDKGDNNESLESILRKLSDRSGISSEAIASAIAAAQAERQRMLGLNEREEWVTQAEAARILGVSRQMVNLLVQRGVIRVRPSDRKVRLNDVLHYYRDRRNVILIELPDAPPPFDPRFVPMAAHAPGHEGEHPWNLMTAEDRERIREIMEQQYREWWKTASPEEKRRAWEDWLRFVAQHGLRGLDTPPVEPK